MNRTPAAPPTGPTRLERPSGPGARASNRARRTLALAGLAHATHDGLTDTVYALLPIWQTEFALGYAALTLLRGLYAGAMAVLQLPAARLGVRLGGRAVLVGGTVVAALGYALAGLSGGFIGLGAALTLSGAGASVQPRRSRAPTAARPADR
jgi:MFS family permease